MSGSWERIVEDVFLFRDSCLVYAVRGPEGTVLVNAGTGLAADHLGEVARGPVTLILTHHFRDHTDGAIRLHAAGAGVLGPYWEQEYLVDPDQHFRERQTWNSYDNRWDRFSPVRPLPVAGWLMDYEERRIAGLIWRVIPTPGVTAGASSYAVTVNGVRIVFAGEIVCGDGRMARVAPLQYNYNDLTGAGNVWHSLRRIEDESPSLILPSLGEPVRDPAAAIAHLRANLREIDRMLPGEAPGWDPEEDDLEEVLPHLFRSRHADAETYYLVSDSGKVMAIDYGYNWSAYAPPSMHHLSNRRPFLHGLRGLKKRFGISRVDAVVTTHYHDDHVNGIPMLQRLFGTELWAAASFADILEHPARYDRPCLWHEPMRVHRVMQDGETVRWEGIPITARFWSGHTRFSALLSLTVDGTRVIHTGDQYFFRNTGDAPYGPAARVHMNHVYKNGLELGCYRHSLRLLEEIRPELVLSGHRVPYRPDARWYEILAEAAAAFDEVHGKLMILGDDEAHFGADSQGGALIPYRLHIPDGGVAEFAGWILNPLPVAATARIALIGPDGWTGEPVSIELGPRERKDIRVRITAPRGAKVRRQPVGLDLTVNERPFGQVAEALVTVGLPRF
ncbi:MAG: MBL fold metallo-hydrolase [Candidatus Coatesbacteria bacterium]